MNGKKLEEWAKEIDSAAAIEATEILAEEAAMFRLLPESTTRKILALVERTFKRGAAKGEVTALGSCGLVS